MAASPWPRRSSGKKPRRSLSRSGKPRKRPKRPARSKISPERARLLKALRELDEKEAREAKQGFVYCVGERGSADYVKIGFTTGDTAAPRSGLQTGNPRKLVVLAFRPGTLADEKTLHTKYAHRRVREGGDEWFRPTKKLLSEFGLTKEALTA